MLILTLMMLAPTLIHAHMCLHSHVPTLIFTFILVHTLHAGSVSQSHTQFLALRPILDPENYSFILLYLPTKLPLSCVHPVAHFSSCWRMILCKVMCRLGITASKGSDSWSLLRSHITHLICSGLNSGTLALFWAELDSTEQGWFLSFRTTKPNHQFFIFLYHSM